MKKHMFYIIALFLASSFSAHAMKMKKFNNNIFKTNHVSKIVNNNIFKYETLKYIKTIHALDKDGQKQSFHTTLPIIHNDDFKVKTIKSVNEENSNDKKEYILLKIKENPKEFIKNFIKIKTLKETSEKNVYLNGIGQKLFYNPENKQFYFDPREVRIQTNGPILGAILYGGTKAVCYGGLFLGIGVAAAATAPVSGAVAAVGGASGGALITTGVIATATTGGTGIVAGVAATAVGSAMGGAGVVGAAATVAGGAAAGASTVTLASAGVAGTVAGIESAASFMGWVGTCFPWL